MTNSNELRVEHDAAGKAADLRLWSFDGAGDDPETDHAASREMTHKWVLIGTEFASGRADALHHADLIEHLDGEARFDAALCGTMAVADDTIFYRIYASGTIEDGPHEAVAAAIQEWATSGSPVVSTPGERHAGL